MSSIDDLFRRVQEATFPEDFEENLGSEYEKVARKLESDYKKEALDQDTYIPKSTEELITEARTLYIVVRDGLSQKNKPKFFHLFGMWSLFNRNKPDLYTLLSKALDYMEAIRVHDEAKRRYGDSPENESAGIRRSYFHNDFIEELLKFDSRLKKYSNSDFGRNGIYIFDRNQLKEEVAHRKYRGMIAIWGAALLIGIRKDFLESKSPGQDYARPEQPN